MPELARLRVYIRGHWQVIKGKQQINTCGNSQTYMYSYNKSKGLFCVFIFVVLCSVHWVITFLCFLSPVSHFPLYLSPASSSLLCQIVFVAWCTSSLVFIVCCLLWRALDFNFDPCLFVHLNPYWFLLLTSLCLTLILPIPFCTLCLIFAHPCMTLSVYWIKALILGTINTVSLFPLQLGLTSNHVDNNSSTKWTAAANTCSYSACVCCSC